MPERRVLLVDLDESGANPGRLWALAEQAWTAHGIAPFIFSSRPGIHLAIRAGYHGEYFPCYTTNGFDYALWNRWLERRILSLGEVYRFDWIVYVGDRPPDGFLSALDGLADRRTAWVRGEPEPPAPADRDIAMQFDLLFEESRVPQIAGARTRRKGRAAKLAPVFRRVSRATQALEPNGSQALFLAGLRNTRFAQRCQNIARDLETHLSGLVLRTRFVDLDGFTEFASVGADRVAPISEALAGLSFVMFEQAEPSTLSTVLSAGVPAILLKGDGLGRDRLADFLKSEGLGLVLDATVAITPRKAKALPGRLAEARRRLAAANLANGAETLWTALLCQSERG